SLSVLRPCHAITVRRGSPFRQTQLAVSPPPSRRLARSISPFHQARLADWPSTCAPLRDSSEPLAVGGLAVFGGHPLQHGVIGAKFRIAVTFGTPVHAPLSTPVAADPPHGHGHHERHRGHLTDAPGDLTTPLLISQSVHTPRQAQCAEVVRGQQAVHR